MRTVLALLVGMLLAVAGVASADSYRLRPGDVLDVTVWQDPKLNRQIVVAPDGLRGLSAWRAVSRRAA